MNIDTLKFRGNGCFKKDWVGLSEIKAINVIIGRNNTGKSRLLDIVKIACKGVNYDFPWEFLCEGYLDERSLREVFAENTSGGDLGGNHWSDNGAKLVGKRMVWECGKGRMPHSIIIFDENSDLIIDISESMYSRLEKVASKPRSMFEGKEFRHLLADRDIRNELAINDLSLSVDGAGATNIIRRLITSVTLQREVVQIELLNALNEIFGNDGNFSEIQVQQHDKDVFMVGETPGLWEVFLGEADKGIVGLTNSGSGLKTIILVLLNLIVIPKIKGNALTEYIFAFEELENNLHPALLRRLLRYIEKFSVENGCTLFITTHSSAALDLFGLSKNASITHVSHDGKSAKTRTVDAHFDRIGVVSDLGVRPSDLLQANGVIWVEGPSDAIYLNKLIRLFSDGELREGRDYICAFYGGSLLARTQFSAPDDAHEELVNLLQINQNVAVICDGDRKCEDAAIKPRVKRICNEIEKIPGAIIWITDCKEIENYLPGSLLKKVFGSEKEFSDPGKFDYFFPSESSDYSYCENVLERKRLDKVELAIACCKHMDKNDIAVRFDLEEKVEKVISAIKKWNV